MGIGNVKLHSNLGEPLDVRASLTLSAFERSSNVRVMLASQKEYQMFGQAIPPSYASIVVEKAKGTRSDSIQISTLQPIREPALTLILKLQYRQASAFKKVVLFTDIERNASTQFEQQIEAKALSLLKDVVLLNGGLKLRLVEQLDDQPNANITILDAKLLDRVASLQPLFTDVMQTRIRLVEDDLPVYSAYREMRLLEKEINSLLKEQAISADAPSVSWTYWVLLLLVVVIAVLFIILFRLWVGESKPRRFEPPNKGLDFENESGSQTSQEETLLAKRKKRAIHVKLANPENVKQKPEKHSHPVKPALHPLPKAKKKQDKQKMKASIVQHAACFEIAVNKGVWKAAYSHYKALFDNVKMQPRIQALYIYMLHQEGRTIARNDALLQIHQTYKDIKWHRFCALIDKNTWQQMQDEQVIGLGGSIMIGALKDSNEKFEKLQNLLGLSDVDFDEPNENKSNGDQAKDGLEVIEWNHYPKGSSHLEDTQEIDEKVVSKMIHLDNNEALPDELVDEFLPDGEDIKHPNEASKIDDDAIEVDFDVDDLLIQEEPEPEKAVFTEIDVEFTGEIEVPEWLNDEEVVGREGK